MSAIRCFLLACLALSGATGCAPVVFRMPADRDVCFGLFTVRHAEFIRFQCDGIYRQVERHHMGVIASDHGHWTQDTSGELTMVSAEHYRDIETGPLSVSMWHTENADHLPSLRTKILKLLAESDAETFPGEQIEAIEMYGQDDCLSRVNVDYECTQVPREALADLVVQIDRFLPSQTKNHFHVTPMSYRGKVFLLWRDAATSTNRDLEEVVSIIKRGDRIRNPSGGTDPLHIFTEIGVRRFEEESVQRQRFLFYPELNDCLREPADNSPDGGR